MYRIKNIIKLSLAVGVYYSGLLALLGFLKRVFLPYSDLTILMYHCVIDDADKRAGYYQPGLIVSQQVFDKQMSFLSKNYKLLSLETVVKLIQNKKSIPRRAMVITFDDGWRNNYSCAYPILKRYMVPATIFVSTDFVDTYRMFWFLQIKLLVGERNSSKKILNDILARLGKEANPFPSAGSPNLTNVYSIESGVDELIEKIKYLNPKIQEKIIDSLIAATNTCMDKWKKERWVLNWDEINQMIQDNIDFGSHGQSHRILTTLSESEVLIELIQSKKIIEDRTGKEVHCFAYPNGDCNSRIRQIVQEAGYSCAVTTKGCEERKRKSDLYALRRVGVHEDMSVDPWGRFSKAMFAFEITVRSKLFRYRTNNKGRRLERGEF